MALVVAADSPVLVLATISICGAAGGPVCAHFPLMTYLEALSSAAAHRLSVYPIETLPVSRPRS